MWWRRRPSRQTHTRSWRRSRGPPGPRCSGGERPAPRGRPLPHGQPPPSVLPSRLASTLMCLLCPCQVLGGLVLGVGQIPGGCQVRAGMRLGNSGWQARAPSHPWPAPRNGIYPLMNFAAARPLGLPRVLAPPPEEAQKAKTPTPEPFDSETRKVSPHPTASRQPTT